MTTEEESEIPTTHHHHPHQHHQNLLDLLDDTIPFLPSFLDEPYSNCDWWDPNPTNLFSLPHVVTESSSPSPATVPPPEQSKKRRRRLAPAEDTEGNNSDDSEVPRKPAVKRNTSSRVSGANSNSNANKEVRWAEQLLNPLAAAIQSSNVPRIQHLIYVLRELASPTGDANHRLASHGLRVLTRNLSPPVSTGGDRNPSQTPTATFATTDPKLFRSALIKFHEISPWFAFPNSLANASILQTLALADKPRSLHVVDIGVSHGIQWPTLLEALTRRSSVPPLVRLTIAGDAIPQGPFSSPPAGYDFPSHLLRYAKSIDLNLKIDRVSSLRRQSLCVEDGEVLVVCAQFRAQHCEVERRSELLRAVREVSPDLVVLTEMEGAEVGEGEGRFAKRAEIAWRFLDSTSAAFKGRECAERRVVEGEMARVLEEGEGTGHLGEGREVWRERMVGAGFREEGFAEEAVDGARALLRKYDGNWEMRLIGASGVGLSWKGHPVSFCSIWKTAN